MHNVRNALAAIAVADELQVSDAAVVNALRDFEGIDRRFQHLGDVETGAGRVMLVDDYGHHPTEVAATLSAARSGWPDRRVVLVFQPHRYTRTRDLMDDFAMVLSAADVALCLMFTRQAKRRSPERTAARLHARFARAARRAGICRDAG